MQIAIAVANAPVPQARVSSLTPLSYVLKYIELPIYS